MSPEFAVLVVIVVFVGLLLAECPVAFSLAASGALGLFLLREDLDLVTTTLSNVPFQSTANYTYAVVPMYILLGMFVLYGKLSERLYGFASTIFRNLRGGLGVATVAACAGFAAVTGSSVATAATIGRVSVDEMRQHGFPASLAAGIVSAAGTLGALIPPSVVLVFYGILAQESIAQLLIAGVIPGILTALVYIVYIFLRAQPLVDREMARLATAGAADRGVVTGAALLAGPEPASVSGESTSSKAGGWASVLAPGLRGPYIRAVFWIAAIFFLVLAGIYTGLFTLIESGGVAALLAFVMLLIEVGPAGRRRLWSAVRNAILETASITSMGFAILVGASIFSSFLVMSRVSVRFSQWVGGLDVAPLFIVIAFLLALIPLGMALDPLSIIIITVPIIHPVIIELGFNGVWFGILMVKLIEMGLVTPPVGMNVFVVSGASGVPVEKTFRGVTPFIGLDLIIVALLIAFPSIVLWLPSAVVG